MGQGKEGREGGERRKRGREGVEKGQNTIPALLLSHFQASYNTAVNTDSIMHCWSQFTGNQHTILCFITRVGKLFVQMTRQFLNILQRSDIQYA